MGGNFSFWENKTHSQKPMDWGWFEAAGTISVAERAEGVIDCFVCSGAQHPSQQQSLGLASAFPLEAGAPRQEKELGGVRRC